MSYTITITENKVVTEVVQGKWVQLLSDDQVAGTKDTPYGYAPDREEPVTKTRTVLQQTVETLDVGAVIKAINNL